MANVIPHGKDKNGQDRWLVRMYVRRDEQGKQIFHNHLVRGTRKDAERYARKMETERDQNTFVEPSKLPLSKFLDTWLDEYVQPRVAPRTCADYRYAMEKYVIPRMGTITLNRLQGMPMQFQKLINEVANSENQEGQKTIRTAQYVFTILKQAMKQAHALGLLARNPMEHMKRPRAEVKEMRSLTPDEAVRFLEASVSDRLHVLFALMVETGLRPGEALGLRWQDIDLEHRAIFVRHSLERLSTGWRLKEPKTKRSRRQIPLTATTANLLRDHRQNQLQERLRSKGKYVDHGFVFATAAGEPLRKNNVLRRHFKPILMAADLSSDIRFYDLRHTCATLLLLAGENPKVVAERLGHASVTMTLDRYSHVLPHMQQSATDKMESMLFDRSKQGGVL
ncbi:tyrosine-type recombinase/integrase [Ferroacidibacillus organovorans]|uniref:Site-specific integrase n=1 Tax=Ferroacidibacillus organovorans TaxID=1765683 RepID=A0A853K9C8_9BACL|nr:site-specific integrase [Ferroacidibacillus organovorans]KYP80055.1 hypothetical protein AYJ22_12600 [Ferroacidibacillus organovorans]OAG93089.1 hypothetical protein AYW79_12500 [Ferroacidibacillus organovorans]